MRSGQLVPWDGGGQGGGPGSPLQKTMTYSVQFPGTQWHVAGAAAGRVHFSSPAFGGSFLLVKTIWRGVVMEGPQPSRWQMPSTLGSLTPSRHTRLHLPPHFTSSIPAQRQPLPMSCRPGSAGKAQALGAFLSFAACFPPGAGKALVGSSLQSGWPLGTGVPRGGSRSFSQSGAGRKRSVGGCTGRQGGLRGYVRVPWG